MTAIKESSTRNFNKEASILECPVSYVLNKIGGNWKPLIIYHLIPGERRYHELRRAIPGITEKMLIQTLRQLEADMLIEREAKPVVPPYVIYRLTESGKDLLPVLKAMGQWAIKDSKKQHVDQYGIFIP